MILKPPILHYLLDRKSGYTSVLGTGTIGALMYSWYNF
jgi:hypothetical protein